MFIYLIICLVYLTIIINNDKKKDETISKTVIPNAGIKVTILISISIIAVIGTIKYIKYRKMKEI